MRRTIAQTALVFASVLTVMALAGCGGSSKTAATAPDPTPTPMPAVEIMGLPSGHTLAAGTIPAGESREVGEAEGVKTRVTCAAGGEACVIAVPAEGRPTSMGGTLMVTSYTEIELPSGHTLAAGTIPAGANLQVADANGMRTVVSCPGGADAQACVVTLTEDGAESTGGAIMVRTFTSITGLPSGHTLTPRTIPAGASLPVGDADGMRTTVTCAAGGEACVVSSKGDGSLESTGGMLEVTTNPLLSNLPEGHTLATGTLAAGMSRVVHDANGMRTTVSCPGGEDAQACVITVATDGTATATGGEPTVTTISYTAIDLPSGHDLEAGRLAAGSSHVVHDDGEGMRTVVSCPGGEDAQACVVTLTEDGAESTGGAITVATRAYAAIDNLPAGHTLAKVTSPMAAGARAMVKAAERGQTYYVKCPDGENACTIEIAEDGSVESSGGIARVETDTHQMVWQANNGPAGNSNGGHARAIERGLARDLGADSAGDATDAKLETVTVAALGGAGGLVQSTAVELPTVTVEWTGTGEEPEIELTLPVALYSALSETNPALGTDPGELAVDTSSTIPGLGTGWHMAALKDDTNNGETLHAVVYSNIEAPEGATDDKPELTFAEDLDLSGFADLNAAVGSSETQTAAVKFSITSEDIGSNVMVSIPGNLFSATSLRSPTSNNLQAPLTGLTVTYEDADGTDQERTGVIMTCKTVCRNAGGTLLGEWDITVEEEPGMAGTPDGNFATLGAWLMVPDSPNEVNGTNSGVNLGVFSYVTIPGNTVLTETQLDGFEGQNTVGDRTSGGILKYEGSAAGLYAKSTYRTAATLTGAEVGAFTADVALTADFGVLYAANSFTGVNGTVSNFLKEDGVTPLRGWAMTLEQTSVGSSGGSDTDSSFTGTTLLETGDGSGAGTGMWGLRFYLGPEVDDAFTNTRLTPVAGTFNAATPAASLAGGGTMLRVVGAFAADFTEKEDRP